MTRSCSCSSSCLCSWCAPRPAQELTETQKQPEHLDGLHSSGAHDAEYLAEQKKLVKFADNQIKRDLGLNSDILLEHMAEEGWIHKDSGDLLAPGDDVVLDGCVWATAYC